MKTIVVHPTNLGEGTLSQNGKRLGRPPGLTFPDHILALVKAGHGNGVSVRDLMTRCHEMGFESDNPRRTITTSVSTLRGRGYPIFRRGDRYYFGQDKGAEVISAGQHITSMEKDLSEDQAAILSILRSYAQAEHGKTPWLTSADIWAELNERFRQRRFRGLKAGSATHGKVGRDIRTMASKGISIEMRHVDGTRRHEYRVGPPKAKRVQADPSADRSREIVGVLMRAYGRQAKAGTDPMIQLSRLVSDAVGRLHDVDGVSVDVIEKEVASALMSATDNIRRNMK